MAQQTEHIGEVNKMITAVEWLEEKLLTEGLDDEFVKQAKQMEKEQIERAFSDGQQTPMNHPTLPHYSREEYYKDNYKK